MIYMDNAATSYPKPACVYRDILDFMRNNCANPGRGGHVMAAQSAMAVFEVRESLCRFFNFDNPLQVCFTKNATEALNIAIKGCLKEGDHVITSCMEHNSVMRPLRTLERDNGIEVTTVRGDSYGKVDAGEFKASIRKNTRLMVCTLSSNVNGIVMPVNDIGKIAAENGILFLVDASQGAGGISVDVGKMRADMLAFPGHKGLLGPQGTGGLWVREGIVLKPQYQGGTGSNSEYPYQPEFMPDLLESGTLNAPGIVGMGSGVGFLENFGLENIKFYKGCLLGKLHDGLSEIKRVRLYSKCNPDENSGIAAFNIDGLDSAEVSTALDKYYGIATRPGLHCAPSAHETLGTVSTGIVRLSPGCFNTFEEIDTVLQAVLQIASGHRPDGRRTKSRGR